MGIANRETIRKLGHAQTTVTIEGEDFCLRKMSGEERDEFEEQAFITDAKGVSRIQKKRLKARLVALCWIDPETGNRYFADDEIHLLNRAIAGDVLAELFVAAQRLNGLDAGAVEDAEKNSEGEATGVSTSG